MSDSKTGGPAFPWNELDQSSGGIYHQNPGMTLRDYFAGMALSGFAGRIAMSARDTLEVAQAGLFYDIADAMLAARNGKEQA